MSVLSRDWILALDPSFLSSGPRALPNSCSAHSSGKQDVLFYSLLSFCWGPAVTGPITCNCAWFWLLSPGRIPKLLAERMHSDILTVWPNLCSSCPVTAAHWSALLPPGDGPASEDKRSVPSVTLDLGFFPLPMAWADVVPTCLAHQCLLQKRRRPAENEGSRPQPLLSLNFCNTGTSWHGLCVDLEIPSVALGALQVKDILKVLDDYWLQTGPVVLHNWYFWVLFPRWRKISVAWLTLSKQANPHGSSIISLVPI